MKKAEKRRFLKRIREARTYLLLLLLLVSIWFIIQFLLFGVFAGKYQAAVLGAIAILDFVAYDFMFAKRRRKRRRAFKRAGKILSAVLSILLAVGAFGMYSIDELLKDMEYDLNIEREVSLIALKDSPLKNLTDMSGSDVTGIQNMVYPRSTKAMLSKMKAVSVAEPETKVYDRLDEMAEALKRKEVSAVILDEDYRALMQDEWDSFTDDTKVLGRITYKEERRNFSRKVDFRAEAFVVLLSGIEEYGSVDTISKPDNNLLVVVNLRTKQIMFVDIPADAYVSIHRNISDTSDKNKDIFANSGLFSTECIVRTAEGVFDIPVNYFVRADLSRIGELEHAVGRTPSVGNTLDRLKGVFLELMKPSFKYNYGKIIDFLRNDVELNFSGKEIKELVKIQVIDKPEWEIHSLSIEGTQEEKMSYFYGEETAAQNLNRQSVREAAQKLKDTAGSAP